MGDVIDVLVGAGSRHGIGVNPGIKDKSEAPVFSPGQKVRARFTPATRCAGISGRIGHAVHPHGEDDATITWLRSAGLVIVSFQGVEDRMLVWFGDLEKANGSAN